VQLEVEGVSFRRSIVAGLVATIVVGGAGAGSSHGAAKPKSYKDCKALNRDYPHGVGRKNARDKTSSERVTNFKRSNRLYAANDGKGGAPPAEYDLDRDNDGIACEQL
jgi:hypothetical protein